ncbi:MAG TPA: hypothetical protein VIG64_00450 [Actinomycetota bacterium]
MRSTTRMKFAVLGLVGLMAAAGSAFLAANTVPASKAGDGAGAVTGYTVSAIHYTLASNPQQIASVQFKLDSAPPTGGTVKVQLAASGPWFDCTLSGTPAVDASCTTTGATVLGATNLTVVAAQ